MRISETEVAFRPCVWDMDRLGSLRRLPIFPGRVYPADAARLPTVFGLTRVSDFISVRRRATNTTRTGKSHRARVVAGKVQDFAADLAEADPQTRPTAVIVYTHFAAISLLRLLWERGIQVPRDVSVSTFSNSYPVAEVIPPLTTAALPTEEMGRIAAEMMLEQIRTSGEAEPRRVVLKETLIIRKSTAPLHTV